MKDKTELTEPMFNKNLTWLLFGIASILLYPIHAGFVFLGILLIILFIKKSYRKARKKQEEENGKQKPEPYY